MNRRSLMISTMLMSAVGVGVGNVWAADVQCLKTPSCEELGYTEVACFQNNGVKCPYGDKYFCVCPTNYKFTCTGENQTGGVGDTCNGKYASCSCSSGLMWNDGACGENCPIGSILFNDFTCSDDVVSGKTPIGVVVYKDGKGAGQAMAPNSLNNGAKVVWSTKNVDISGIPNYSSREAASKGLSSCANSLKMRAQGNSPAVMQAYNYSTAGTNVGDWCLPDSGIITSYYNNQDIVNPQLLKIGGTIFLDKSPYTFVWSSSEYSSGQAWRSSFSSEYGLYNPNKNSEAEVRPVIGFCDDKENYVYDQTTDSCVKDGCQIGAIFYSDKTCSMQLRDGKTPIGVVVYIDSNGGGQVMSLSKVGGTVYMWDIRSYSDRDNVFDLNDFEYSDRASQDFTSCENTGKILAQGNNSIYPAAWAAHEYSTEGTSAGDWCLPAAGIFTSIYNNLEAINMGFRRVGKTEFSSITRAWSSSENDSNDAWSLDLSYLYGLTDSSKNASREVRPVLEGSITSEGDGFCTNSYQYTCDGANETGGSSTSCGGKFQSCNCASGYEWNGSSCACPSTYKYTCSGTGYSGGSGTACGGKYAACVCKTPYKWNGSSCACPSTYKYTCTGANQTGGSGTACGGKYTACKCSSGYFWSRESCLANNACMKGSQLGYILNSDMTVTSTKQSGKTPIGVVVCSYSGGGGQAMALKSVGSYVWGGHGTDIPTLTNYGYESVAYKDTDSCGNTEKIISYGDSNNYPAAWATYNYSTEGTKAGDWCLPAAGTFTSYFANQSTINAGFEAVGGSPLISAYQEGNTSQVWSSSELNLYEAWRSCFDCGSTMCGLQVGDFDMLYKEKSHEVRPVIEF